MSQNPFHLQDSLFRFDTSGNLVVDFNEINSQRQQIQDDPINEQDDTSVIIEPNFDIQVWLKKL